MLDRGLSNFSYIYQYFGKFLPLSVLAAAILILSQSPVFAQAPIAQKLDSPIFAEVFHEIVEYHVNPPSGKQLFYYAVSIIQKQDPYIQTREQGHLVIYYNHKPLFAFRIAPENDAAKWGAISQSLIEQIYPYSAALQKQPLDVTAQNILKTLVQVLDKYSHVTVYGAKSSGENFAEIEDPKASIGVTITTDGHRAVISKIIPHSPAASYLNVGDIIESVDGRDVSALKAKQIVGLFRGAPDSIVEIGVDQDGKKKQLSIKRVMLSPDSFETYLKKDILFVNIKKFTPGMAQKMIANLRPIQTKIAGVVLDLRGNRGGVLSEATAIADMFLASGSMTIGMRGRHPDSVSVFESTNHDIRIDSPIVILVDGQTASSAEVLAAALQSNKRAVVVGTQSYGKGMVQRATYIEGLGQLAITWAELYKPGTQGASLDQNGVLPNICLASANLNTTPLQQTPEPDKFVMWFRRAPQVTWDSKICPKSVRKDKTEDASFAASLLSNPELYRKALNNKQI